MGYRRAGFDEIVGVDITPQPRYPFTFVHGDALAFLASYGAGFDAIHASPPCQRYSVNTKQHNTMSAHPDLLAPTRLGLQRSGRAWIIENVPGAPLEQPITLCGSQFGWERLRRHRRFESNWILQPPGACDHRIQRDCISVTGHTGGTSRRDGGERFGGTAVWRALMGIDWMTGAELAEAIPPAYTEYLGVQLYAGLLCQREVAS